MAAWRAIPVIVLVLSTGCAEESWAPDVPGEAPAIAELPGDRLPPPPSLNIAGTCPGVMAIQVRELSAFGPFGIASGEALGAFQIPQGAPCEGLPLGIDQEVRLRLTGDADDYGSFLASPNIPAGACGLFVQVVDLDTCTTSNVDVL